MTTLLLLLAMHGSFLALSLATVGARRDPANRTLAALVGVAATVRLDEAGRCEDARLVFLSVGEGPVEAQQAADALLVALGDDERQVVAYAVEALGRMRWKPRQRYSN